MSIPYLNTLSSPTEQQIAQEQQKYKEALTLDAPFAVLKEIRNKIKLLIEKEGKPSQINK